MSYTFTIKQLIPEPDNAWQAHLQMRRDARKLLRQELGYRVTEQLEICRQLPVIETVLLVERNNLQERVKITTEVSTQIPAEVADELP